MIKRYTPPITDYHVELYEHESPLFRFKATLFFIDSSRLRIKEYLFADGSRKYSFHWESEEGILKVRWDNAEHWLNVSTFPHHKHLYNCDGVQPSTDTALEDVLKIIKAQLVSIS